MRTIVPIGALLIITAGFAVDQRASATDLNVSRALDGMKSTAWAERSKAVDEAAALLASGKSLASDLDDLRLGLIQLLATENKERKPASDAAGQSLANQRTADETEDETALSGTWSEDRSEYYAGLIGTVAGLADERAIPVLLAAASTGGMAIRGVARFGKKALDPVLDQVKSQDSYLASGAVFVLAKMLEFRTVRDPDSHLRIKNSLRWALSSPDGGVRDVAVFAIEYLDDREEFVPILKNLAEHDPYKLGGQPLFDGTVGDLYFVRDHAKRVLRSIANHEPPTVDKGLELRQ